mmetsp:Transcript_86633/g.250196  ORF Transcript_86633/g.250196 Transcript_86633/m.250196 type:complete len:205 (+) Transcript_86633:2113-2727(+)
MRFLIAEQRAGAGKVPIRNDRLCSSLGFPEHRDNCADHRRLTVHGSEVVVEHRLADDIQRGGGELLLHVHRRHGSGPGGGDGTLQVIAKPVCALNDHLRGVLQPLLVEAWHDRPTPRPPCDGVRRDQALAHDRLQHLAQNALGVVFLRVLQDVLDEDRVGHHHRGARADDELEHAGALPVGLEEYRHRRAGHALHPTGHHVPHQ